MYIYFGEHNNANRIVKIGQTKRSCKARCQYDDYTITVGYDYDDLTANDLTMLESVVRVAMEQQGFIPLKMDYFEMPKGMHKATAEKAFHEAVAKANAVLTLMGKSPNYEIETGNCIVYGY